MRRGHLAAAAVVVVGGAFVGFGLAGASARSATGADDAAAEDEASSTGQSTQSAVDGEDLFRTRCSSCHGVDGKGIEGRGPTLYGEGAAAADFVLRTGRMPLADPNLEATGGPVRFTEAEIVALVDFVGSLGDGPPIPEVDPSQGDLQNGGDIYRLNCAACHVASGSGAIIGGGRRAPNLMDATPTQIGEAIEVGPGAMPVFGEFTTQDVNDVAAYIGDLQDQRTTDVQALGGIGPVAEGLVTWLVPLAILIALTRWIGTPRLKSDPAQPDTGENQ